MYRISSVLNKAMVLTVDQEGKVSVNKHKNNKNQHFKIYQENNKYAIVVGSNNSGICVFQDKQDNGIQVITDAGKHASSWFEIVRVNSGPFAHKGYLIKTHSQNKCLDINGGKAEDGKAVLQYNVHEGGNQVWLVEPCNKAKANKIAQQQQQQQGHGYNWGQHFEEEEHHVDVIPYGNQGNNQGMGFIQNAQFKPNQNYIFYAVHGNGIKALDIAQDQANYGQLIMYSFHGAPNQRFVFEQEGNMYRIKNVKENKYLNVANDDSYFGTGIRVDDKGKYESQLWTIIPATDPKYAGKGAFHLRSIFGQALETPKDSLDNSAKIQQGEFHNADGQTWIIKEI